MASGWDEHKAELEWLYLRAQPTNTIKQIKGIMESAHAFTRRSARSSLQKAILIESL